MSVIDDFFLNDKRICAVVKEKIENELLLDLAARKAIENLDVNAATQVVKWMEHYGVVQGFTRETRLKLAEALIQQSSELTHNLTPTIRDRHVALSTICNSVEGVRNKDKETGDETDRDCTSLSSKLLWLTHPSEIPIFDARAWDAINVIARILEVAATPDPADRSRVTLDQYCVLLKLHETCFSHLYSKIDEIVTREFEAIFNSTRQTEVGSMQFAREQYSHHMTVIDQILWHLGGAIPLDGCFSRSREKKLGVDDVKSEVPTDDRVA